MWHVHVRSWRALGLSDLYARTRTPANLGGSEHQASLATLLPATCRNVSAVSLRLGRIASQLLHTLGLRLVSEFASLFEQAHSITGSSSTPIGLSFDILFLSLFFDARTLIDDRFTPDVGVMGRDNADHEHQCAGRYGKSYPHGNRSFTLGQKIARPATMTSGPTM